MMSKPDSEMDGTICKECNRLISDHLPEELEECMRKTEFKKLDVFISHQEKVVSVYMIYSCSFRYLI